MHKLNVSRSVAAILPFIALATTASTTLDNINVKFGADYESAEFTATVSDPTAKYSIVFNGISADGTVSGSTVTFNIAGIERTTATDIAAWTVTAGSDTISGATYIADKTSGWVDESSSNHTTGEWKDASDAAMSISYDENGFASVENASFDPANDSSGDIVEISFRAKFGGANTEDTTATPTAALRIGETADAPVFQIFTRVNDEPTWVDVSAENLEPDGNTIYNVVFTLNYATKHYSAKIGGQTLATTGGETSFSFADPSATCVSSFYFVGNGQLASIYGSCYEGNMASLGGTKYLTAAQAVAEAEKSANPDAITLLHASSKRPADWKESGSTWVWDTTVTIADGAAVEIPKTFLEKLPKDTTVAEKRALLAPDSTTTRSNGFNYYTCYALGLLDGDEPAKPAVSLDGISSNGEIVLKLGGCGTIPDNINATVKAQTKVNGVWTDLDGATATGKDTIVLSPAEITGGGNVGQLRFNVVISGAANQPSGS